MGSRGKQPESKLNSKMITKTAVLKPIKNDFYRSTVPQTNKKDQGNS